MLGVKSLERCRSASFDGPVAVGRTRKVRIHETFPGLVDISRASSLGEHHSPQEVCSSGEELCICSFARRGRGGEVGVRFVVSAEHGGQAAKEQADRALHCWSRGG